jgi:hypothetical protein
MFPYRPFLFQSENSKTKKNENENYGDLARTKPYVSESNILIVIIIISL